jgi:hypothetical protein
MSKPHVAGMYLMTTHLYSPPLAKGGEGGFVTDLIFKSPLIPLFQRGRFDWMPAYYLRT